MDGKEWNGKALKYDFNFDDFLDFEGEFLRGEKNGKGKKYKIGRLIFEGEYINGKENGKGKEYYNNKEIYHKFFENGDSDSYSDSASE